jgi:hypothetical protein
MLGGAALLADGIITPPISITSAIEGLRELPMLRELGRHYQYPGAVFLPAAVRHHRHWQIVRTYNVYLVYHAGHTGGVPYFR